MIIERIKTEYYMCRIPGLIATDNGTLIGCYECRSEYSDWAQIDIRVIRSTDGGNSFERVHLISGDGDTLNNPVMVQKDGVIHFLYLKNYHELFYCKSTDDGVTFTQPVDITDVLKSSGFFYSCAALGPGHGIVHNGRIIFPVWIAANHDDPKAHHPTSVTTLYSDDDGASWHFGEWIGENLIDPNESALVSVGDSVMISIRNHSGYKRAFAVSKTGIDGWGEAALYDNMNDSICMGSMFAVGDTVYHINCDNDDKPRINLTVKISRDGFKSYESIVVDEKGGYADLCVVGDKLHILYERDFKDEENYSLNFVTIDLTKSAT